MNTCNHEHKQENYLKITGNFMEYMIRCGHSDGDSFDSQQTARLKRIAA